MKAPSQKKYAVFFRKVSKRILPKSIYQRYIGRHEQESMRQWVHLSKSAPKGSWILDIGAFLGEYAIASRKHNSNAKIAAFEPNPESAERLREECNALDIEVEERIVSERDGTTKFMMNSQMSQIVHADTENSPDILELETISLDSWIAGNEAAPWLIKIDVEGAEAGILRGAKKLLSLYRPIILCEVLSDGSGTDVSIVLPENYVYYYIDENSGIERCDKITRKVWRNHNWLFVPNNKISELLNLSGSVANNMTESENRQD